MNKIRFTKEGFAKIQKDYEEFLAQRPAVVEDLKKAREMGDLSENGYYKASRQKLSFIDGQLFRCKIQMKQAVIVEETNHNSIDIGTTVTLKENNTTLIYTIVGDLEANPAEKKISLLSPLGRALEGKKLGDTVALTLPKGKITYTIISITS